MVKKYNMIVNLNGKRVIFKKNITKKEALSIFDKESGNGKKLEKVRSFELKPLVK